MGGSTKQRIVLIVALAMVSMGVASSVGGAVPDVGIANPPISEEADRYIVAFLKPHSLQPGDTYQGEPVVKVIDGLNFAVVEVRNLPVFEARVALDDNVRYIEYDNPEIAELHFVPNDYFYGHAAHWGSKRIGGEAAWDVTLGSTAIKVAHIDSGINRGHEEYAGQSRVLQGYDFKDGDNDPDDARGCDWHGSHTTGTAGATINNGLGIAGMSQHTILPVKIFGKGFGGCGTTTTAIVEALKYAADQGAHLSSNSWGGGSSSTAINDAIAYAHGKGTIHVASAGNSGPCSNCVGQPWKDNPGRAIVVSSLTDGDTFSSFSSQGPEVDVIAPGEYIAGPGGGTNEYLAMSGTSMAAPHVTGSLALYMAATGNTAYSTVENALKSTTEDLGFSSDRQGSGLVRADGLVAGGGGGTPTYACSDGVDNDGDGLTDYPNDPGCDSDTDNDETDPAEPAPIDLNVNAYKVKGVQHADLTWSGATSTLVDVYENGGLLITTDNDGAYTHNRGVKGGATVEYQVCEAGTTTCSNVVTATW